MDGIYSRTQVVFLTIYTYFIFGLACSITNPGMTKATRRLVRVSHRPASSMTKSQRLNGHMFVTLYLLSLILVLCTSIKMKSWQGMISLPPVNLQRKTLRRLSPAALLRKLIEATCIRDFILLDHYPQVRVGTYCKSPGKPKVLPWTLLFLPRYC